LINLSDDSFATTGDAAQTRQSLVASYVAAFRKVVAGERDEARTLLRGLAADLDAKVVPDDRPALREMVDALELLVSRESSVASR
jgi:hypothetical protein